MQLRRYQRLAIDALYSHWREGGGNALIELATGTGKSLVAATLARELLEQYPDMRLLVITHQRELIAQNCSEMLKLWPQAPVGIYSAGLGRRDARARILFAGIQSVHDKASVIGRVDLMIIDEAHLLPRKSDTQYQRFITDAKAIQPKMQIVGLTATPYRLDSGRLDGGPDAVFKQVVYSYGIKDGIRDGYLAPLVSKGMVSEIDTSDVHVRGGEFVPSELEAAAMSGDAVERAVAEMCKFGADRKAWIVFCTGVEHAHKVKMTLLARNIEAACVTGSTPNGERDRIIQAFKSGRIRALCGVSVLTTGFNVPAVDMIALMRPTLSTGLYVQMVGRGTRTAPGKTDCLVLDFAGVIRRHGPVDAVSLSGKRAVNDDEKTERVKRDEVRAKACPECLTINALAARRCISCGHDWSAAPKHEGEADPSAEVLTRDAPKTVRVKDWRFARHEKKGGLPSMRVEYSIGLMEEYREWLCFDHDGGARRKAVSVWSALGGAFPPPMDVTEALDRSGELRMPEEITVKQEGRFWSITSRSTNRVDAAA